MKPRRRALSLWLPNWPITRLNRNMSVPHATGLATTLVQDNARRLAAVDDVAAANGLMPGQSLTDAMALCPETRFVDADPEDDARALAGLADWCLRFSPAVAVDAPDGLFMDIDGCAHLWGGEEAMAQALMARLAAQAIPARLAIADAFAAAWALARFSGEALTITAGDDGRRLAALPVSALRLEESVAAQLRHLGLKTIGHLTALPRPALRKRFGAGLLLQLGRALGEEDIALDFRTPPASWSERAVFFEPISTPEDKARVIADLAAQLCDKLDGRGLGARRFEAVFHRVDGDSVWRSVRAAMPLRDARRLAALFAPKLDSVDPGFGIEIVTLTARRTEFLTPAQTDFERTQAEAADIAPLVDRFVNRFGAERVWRAAVQESHVPERAVARVAPLTQDGGARWAEDQPRPVRLFARPLPIEAMAVAPDDPPFLFRWQGRTHRVRMAEGPERIAAEWWRKAWDDNEIDRVRDYYRVEDESGARFWVFRTGFYGGERPTRWFLHGLFA